MPDIVIELIQLFATLLLDIFSSGEDIAKQEAALMAAEEKIAAQRARLKFGSPAGG